MFNVYGTRPLVEPIGVVSNLDREYYLAASQTDTSNPPATWNGSDTAGCSKDGNGLVGGNLSKTVHNLTEYSVEAEPPRPPCRQGFV